ncbi:MAG: GGDEF domain-containing protein [Tissierella sp.]|nr:GGDEF domain-containing protein [Tissierella sp.]
MNITKDRKANIKIYIIPFIIVSLITAIILMAMSNSIKNHFYDLKKEEGLKIARSISTNLSHTGEAADTISQLLEDKLENSLKTAQIYSCNYSDEILIELADTFNIDEVYIYNSQGIIEYSNSGKYVGWKPHENHPVYYFMNSDDEIRIEDIRKDSESELFYKYGYIKNQDGTMVQIGILAEKVNQLFESIRVQNLLDEMVIDDAIIQLGALDSSYIITASTADEFIGYQLKDEEIISDINSGKIHDRINSSSGEDLYEIFVPLDYESNEIVAFGIQYSLSGILPLIKMNILNTIIGLIIVYITLIFSIVSTYKRNKKLVYLAYYDSLTGLPNTESLIQRFNENKGKNNGAIFMVKCANISLINQAFGYEYGNKVLKELGNRIKTIQNKNIILFRFTSDKLVLYLQDFKEKEELLRTLEEIKDILQQPFRVNDSNQYIIVKIGIIEFNGASKKSLDQLLKEATIALNYVDTSTNYSYSFYDQNMESNIQREEIIERELRTAISNEDISKIYLAYQPIIDTKTNKIDGFEALARMNSDQIGPVSPAEFIKIAERKQLIIPFTNFILKVACKFIADLTRMGYNDLRVAVNISTIHVLQENFVNTVLNIMEEAGISGQNLELELTETIMLENFQITNQRLKELRASGIQISLDDFGTGYSSFDRLSELNVDTLKIDQHFINNITELNKASLITKDIISIAHKLGLKTVAEGVEFHAQKDYLEEYSCDKLQGYLFSKAVSKEEAILLLDKYNKN